MPLQAGEKVYELHDAARVCGLIREARERHKLSIKWLAEETGFVASHLAKIERGSQRYFSGRISEKMETLFKFLEIDLKELAFAEADWRKVTSAAAKARKPKRRRDMGPPNAWTQTTALTPEQVEAHRVADYNQRVAEQNRVADLTARMTYVRSIAAAYKRGILPPDQAMAILSMVVEVH